VEERAVRGPATHAIVIGVGKYDHLPGGGGTPVRRPEGMRQLTSPPASARRFAEWLISGLNYPPKPLASVALLLPHHGSRYNLSPELLALVDCRRFLISSNGSYFDHPDGETISRILTTVRGAELIFNYRSEEALVWLDDDLIDQWRYTPTYPAEAEKAR
jgi:hypothetical protein